MISSEELPPIKARGPWASGHLRSCSLEVTWGHLLSGSLNLWHPYKRISIIDSSFKFCDEKYLSETLLRRFCLSVTKKGQRMKKYSVVSGFVRQSHIVATVSLKSWRNLCSFKWVLYRRLSGQFQASSLFSQKMLNIEKALTKSKH